MEHGEDPTRYEKFDLVCSGHYHMKSRIGNVNYLGNPYQLYWNDYGHDRGFHILNTNTTRLKFYKNPFETFHKIYYTGNKTEIPTGLEGKYVKVVVETKGDQLIFDHKMRELQDSGLADLKIIEDMSYDTDVWDNVGDIELEDTLTLLEQSLEDMPNKDNIFNILKSLYMEASEV